MTQEELFDALDGLRAYDDGFTDSGIHDEALRERVIALLRSYNKALLNRVIATMVREHYLSDAAIEHGYGLEDAVAFIKWLTEEDMLVDDIWRLRW